MQQVAPRTTAVQHTARGRRENDFGVLRREYPKTTWVVISDKVQTGEAYDDTAPPRRLRPLRDNRSRPSQWQERQNLALMSSMYKTPATFTGRCVTQTGCGLRVGLHTMYVESAAVVNFLSRPAPATGGLLRLRVLRWGRNWTMQWRKDYAVIKHGKLKSNQCRYCTVAVIPFAAETVQIALARAVR